MIGEGSKIGKKAALIIAAAIKAEEANPDMSSEACAYRRYTNPKRRQKAADEALNAAVAVAHCQPK